MSEPDDLDRVEAEIKESRKAFLAACKLYDDEGRESAQIVVERFLVEVIGPKSQRPESIHKMAREAIDLIKHFEAVRTNLITKVALVALRFEQLEMSLRTAVMESLLGSSKTGDIPPELRALDVIKHIVDDLNASWRETGVVFKEGSAKAVEAGKVVVKLQHLATLLVIMRLYTLRVFRMENVDDSLFKKMERVTEVLFEELNSWTVDMAMEKSWELIQAIGVVVCGVTAPAATPFLPLLKMLWKSAKATQKPKMSHEKSPSDITVELRDRLTEQNQFFDVVLQACNETYDRVDAIAGII
jgi:hypothetical protein